MFGFSNKGVTFISFRCSLFVFAYKGVTFISFRYSLFFFHTNEVPLFSKIRKKHGVTLCMSMWPYI